MSLPENITCYDIIIMDVVGKGSNSLRSIAIHYAAMEALASIDVADGLLSRAIKGNALFIPVTELVLMQKLQSLGVQDECQRSSNLKHSFRCAPK
ncbi:uncharacterized protein F5891DRAFT_1187523 [Suillus fuscotomentosus]|uniref:Uncharacterized protein n=1 Tax=Suillus fuscotomentosus TaxID=1912939 RepID=A0AAD4E8F5_9AGAM|nr:uncharacterized protein F5891DRAFT_1187523 [Suillus fuscotomentosus]KAG1901643.1 hypothetical protein F5891DRAFT_1187523 [Suillus fuscotomentosus]